MNAPDDLTSDETALLSGTLDYEIAVARKLLALARGALAVPIPTESASCERLFKLIGEVLPILERIEALERERNSLGNIVRVTRH